MRLSAAMLALIAVLTGACGDESAAGCTETREPLDPLSLQHVIDADSATFLTDPPTSGPHLSGPSPNGLLGEPLTPAAQVRVLEEGGVVVQYRPPVEPAELEPLFVRVDGRLVIAPGDALPAPLVATAWTWKLTCESTDIDALAAFASARTVDAPGTD